MEKAKLDTDSETDDNNPESQDFANKIIRILAKKVRDLSEEEFTIWRDYTGDDEDKEMLQIEFEADKIFKREEKEKEKKKQTEEKKKQAEYLKELKKPREDLECENLVELPKPIPIKSKLTQDMFGDALMILEFLNSFGDLFELKADFPNGFNFNLLENALFSKSCDSALCNLLLFFLDSIFKCYDEETFDDADSDSESVHEDLNEVESEEIGLDSLYKDSFQKAADRDSFADLAEDFSKLVKNIHGKNMIRIGLDVYTISEMLRLYFLTCAASNMHKIKFWYQQRGGYTRMDESGIDFALHEKAILKKLEVMNVFELEPSEKLKILTCLCTQLMSQVRFRDLLEDNFHKMSQLRAQLRDLQTEENRRVREEASERWKKKMLERANQKEASQQKPTKERVSLGNDEEDAKLLAESSKKRDDYLKKERGLLEELYQLQIKYSMAPLGRDRYHRRYWIFKSLPGLFVEDDSNYEIDPPLKISPKKESKENKNFGKENFPKTEYTPKVLNEYVLGETKWGFYYTAESLEQLLELLTERGIRESELKQVVTDFKTKIVEHVDKSNFLITYLTMSEEDIETSLKNCLKENVSNVLANSQIQNSMPKKRGPKPKELKEALHMSDSSSQLSNSNFSAISAQEYMENDLKEKLIALEEQVLIGGLGHLKVDNRLKWKEIIQSGRYEPFCENLSWGDLTRPAKEVTNVENFKMNVDYLSSSKCESLSTEVQLVIVNNFAKIMLQIEQSVDKKFLRTPLGDILKTPDRKKKGDEQRYCVIQNWEKSLMSCTTLSQLFIHLQNLDESIAWSKSALNAKCKTCHKKGDPEHMLLCRKCDRAYHLYCLRPALSSMPTEDWHCAVCRPKTVEKTPRKIRKTFYDDMYSDENSQMNEETEAKPKKRKRKNEDAESQDEAMESEHEVENYFEIEIKKRPRGRPKLKVNEEENNDESVEDENEKKRPRKRKFTEEYEEKKPAKSSKNIASTSTTSTTSNGSSTENGHKRLGRSRSAKSLYCELSDDFSANGTDEEAINHKKKRTKTIEASPGSSTSTRNLETSERIKKVDIILKDLFKHKDAWPFLKPVTKRQAPDYFEVITKPIDFSTIRKKIKSFEYTDYTEIIADIRQVFENCRVYNEPGSEIYETGERVSDYFEKEAKKAGLLDTKQLASTTH